MFFPELLYQLSARDQQITWLDPSLRSDEVSQLATQIDSDFLVPEGRALVLTNVNVEAQAGAGQTSTLMQIMLFRGGLFSHLRQDNLAAANFNSQHWTGEVIVPAGWSVRARVIFNALVNANAVKLRTQGILIPIGNVQRI